MSNQQTGVYIQDEEYGWLPAKLVPPSSCGSSSSSSSSSSSLTITTSSSSSMLIQVEVTIPDQQHEHEQHELRTVDLSEYSNYNNTLPLQNIHTSTGHKIIVADMCDLPSLHEPGILYNLQERHFLNLPYTRVGDILIAMNPFEWITELYSEEKQRLYTRTLVHNSTSTTSTTSASIDSSTNKSMQVLEPHLYEVSSLAYKGLAIDSTHQSILVSGESGAGKTESVKIIMSHLASIHHHGNDNNNDTHDNHNQTHENNYNDGQHSESNQVIKRVLDSNPLLEAFGNARTIRNDNSSRFGKYISLQFDVEDATSALYKNKNIPSCLLAGSKVETYLLETSRVVGHDEENERGYHIFYQLLACGNDVKGGIWEGLAGLDHGSFGYLGNMCTSTSTNEIIKIEGQTDGERWVNTVKALALIGVVGDKFRSLMRSLCIVLQLGNLIIENDPDNEDGSIIASTSTSTELSELAKLSELMGVPMEVIEKSLTFRTIHAGGKEKCSVKVPLRAHIARDARDTFAKAIYQHAFDWLVEEINCATCAEENYRDADAAIINISNVNANANAKEECERERECSNGYGYGTIGLLDIFGFETFRVNRFEQFCINYANEKLQQKYNKDIFSSVQNEYGYEGIPMPEVAFLDNSQVLHLIEGRMGFISMLNEECLRPHGNDASFVAKVKTVNKDMECLVKDPLHRNVQFGIEHFAGKVVYDASCFVKKNMDKLAQDLVDCAGLSSNPLILLMSLESNNHAHTTSSSKGNGKGNGGIQKGGRTLSVTSKFRSQLHNLMQIIQKTKTRYVRCIKPNADKIPKKIDLRSSVEQLRCAGVVAAVTISRVSYPNRLTHQIALDRFTCIACHGIDEVGVNADADADADAQGVIRAFMKDILSGFDGQGGTSFACGKTRVYFKTGALEFLEGKRMRKLGTLATLVQKMMRGYMSHAKYNQLRDTSIYLQSLVRRNRARRDLDEACKAVTLVSCWVRCLNAKSQLCHLRKKMASTLIQTRFRIVMARKVLESCIHASLCIQKVWRGAIQRPRYRDMVVEAEEEARVNTKIAALQKRLADAEMKWIKADKARIEAEKRAYGVNSLSDEEEKKIDDGNSDDKELLDESTQMIEFLQQDNSKLRHKVHAVTSDLDEMKVAHSHLSEQYVGLQDSNEAVKHYASEMSQANMVLNMKNMELKKKYSEAKKNMKKFRTDDKSKIQKVTDLMKAKDRDHKSEIKRLQGVVSAGQDIGASIHHSKKKQIVNKRHAMPPMGQGKMRAKVHGRASPAFYRGSSISSIADEERWGNDGYYDLDSDASYPDARFTGDETAKMNFKKPKSPSALPNTSLGRRVVSPDYGTNKLEKQHSFSPSSSLQREASSSSLVDALNRNESGSKPNSKRSTLAAAASKPSSLAMRARQG